MTRIKGRSGMLVAALVLGWALTVVAQSGSQSAPVQTTPAAAQVSQGLYLYDTYCAVCHGRSAQGDGPLAASLRRRPPNLTLIFKRHNGVFPTDTVTRIVDGREKVAGHGGEDMPVWGDAFRRSVEGGSEEKVQERIKAIVRYLESLQVRDVE
jgi:hypothetical protein